MYPLTEPASAQAEQYSACSACEGTCGTCGTRGDLWHTNWPPAPQQHPAAPSSTQSPLPPMSWGGWRTSIQPCTSQVTTTSSRVLFAAIATQTLQIQDARNFIST